MPSSLWITARIVHWAAPVAVALLVAACTTAGSTQPAGSSPPPTGSDDASAGATPASTAAPSATGTAKLVFEAEYEGGFVAPGARLGQLPIVAVYDDGRVFTQGPQIEIYPGPLLPKVQVRTISRAALQRLIDLAREKTLLRNASYDMPGIADVATTVVTLVVDGQTYQQRAYALAEGADSDARVSATDREARANLRAFVDALQNVPESAIVVPDAAYEPEAFRVFVTPADLAAGDQNLPQQPIEWPLPGDLGTRGTPVANAGNIASCLALDGTDARTVAPLFAKANTLTPFVSGGKRYLLTIRPLLPDEHDC